ncbi:phosphotransferase [Thermoanaerobacterium thermosaccharolyticum]|nr:HPr family phosphocarrier protein [Thermoanaerobacterium thermosaccharolyticum]AST57551.1 HPr-related phosphotransferase system component [Thermoanaerobacterium thermosaccharolyticum]KAA5806194.1 HPr family phosphocarrier protein [Thermoanaerobacterium thermosaccharolyticum]OXT07322.1 phosphotransferase [Thermoanaerobacterium thermosaccharolyticum]PHO06399.1 phosphotransferase [Thermoanaerobacterium thermosaccharolyticum]
MKEFNVYLNSIDKVKNFVEKMSKYPFDIDIVSGRYVIDAKSIMGIFSLNLENQLTVIPHTEDEEALSKFSDDIKEYIAQKQL